MKAFLLAIPVVAASLLSAQAEEKVVKMKLVTKLQQEAAGGSHWFGVIFQRDGAIGSKDYFVKAAPKKGEFVGLSTYTFEDGSITASFTGQELEKGHDKGTYVILSGTGTYEGAKGGGGFEGVGAENSPVKGVGIYDVALNVTLPPRN
jgi:hypothetical protein